MAKPEWGTKRRCQSCDKPFYDLKKKNIECPNCGAPFIIAPQPKPRRSTPSTPKPKEDKAVVPAENENNLLESDLKSTEDITAESISTDDIDNDIEETDGEDDNSLIEDTSDLGASEDEIPKIDGSKDYGID